MFVRRKTSFKPNLKQVGQQQPAFINNNTNNQPTANQKTSTTTTTPGNSGDCSTSKQSIEQQQQQDDIDKINPSESIPNNSTASSVGLTANQSLETGKDGHEFTRPLPPPSHIPLPSTTSSASSPQQDKQIERSHPSNSHTELANINSTELCNIPADDNSADHQITTPTTTSLSSANPDRDGPNNNQLTSLTRGQEVSTSRGSLSGQKFEPIKSLSLRSSVNKNVKLKDLLFFNPPMTKDQKRHKKSVSLAKKSEKKKIQEDCEREAAERKKEEESSGSHEPSLAPKVKMGPDGNLILDESSTVINRKNVIKEKEAIFEDNDDIISKTNYDSYRRRPSNVSQSKWSPEDTQKFYHALTILGTDFSMMESLLFSGARSRTELHKKFKREERVNKLKVDIALSNRISLNSEELEDLKEVFYES